MSRWFFPVSFLAREWCPLQGVWGYLYLLKMKMEMKGRHLAVHQSPPLVLALVGSLVAGYRSKIECYCHAFDGPIHHARSDCNTSMGHLWIQPASPAPLPCQ